MRVAVVGATGAVGSTILGVMRERTFAADTIVPFASARSAGRKIDYGEASLTVRSLSEETIQGFDLALFSAGSHTSEEWAPRFVEAGAVQYGFCTPGLVVATADLLQRNADPSDDEIREALSGNLCRCTGYQKILDAVHLAAGR